MNLFRARLSTALFLLLILFWACNDSNTNWLSDVEPDDGVYIASALTQKKPFVAYQATRLDYQPSLQTYTLPLDLTEINNLDRDIRGNSLQFVWSADAEDKLMADGLVVLPAKARITRFDDAYEDLKDSEMPILVTTDSVLHLYHLFFSQILKNIEVRELIPMLKALLPQLAAKLSSIYKSQTDDLKEAARRDLAFITVAWKLVDPDHAVLHPDVKSEVKKALEYIESAGQDLEGGREVSPIFNRECPRNLTCAMGKDLPEQDYEQGKACYCEDYTQYKPRGHYTESEALQRYFRSAMYLGRMSMRIKSPMETRMAALFTASMNKTTVAYQDSELGAPFIWDRIYRTVSFFVGAADDLTFIEYDRVLREVYGEDFSIEDLADDAKLRTLRTRLREEREPEILSGFVDALLDNTEQTMGLRFLGQRFAFDSYTLGELVFKKVGPNPNHPDYQYVLDNLEPLCMDETEEEKITGNFAQCQGQSLADWRYICCSAVELAKAKQRRELAEVCRLLPSGLDVAATFGSERARQHLQDDIDGYCEYREQLDSLGREADAFADQDWFKTLYTSWLFALQPFFNQDLTGFPAWMTTDAYQDKSLNTALTSWAELRHDTILYVKQSYTSMANKGPSAPPEEPEAMYWVEPLPEVYQALIDLSNMTRKGLSEMALFADQLSRPFDRLVGLLDRLKTASLNELDGKELTPIEISTIKYMGSTIKAIVLQLGKATAVPVEKPDPDAAEKLETDSDPYKTTIVADVHTDGNMEEVLQVGSGYIDWMVVVRRLNSGVLGATIGPVFSYYEFPWPMKNRLTDEQWKELLDGGETPQRPDFVRGILTP